MPRPGVLLIPEVVPPPASPLPLPPPPHRRPDHLQARAQQQRGGHARRGDPPRRARQLKIWDLQPELPPAPHLRHDRALEREFAQQLRNLPPELPPASQPDAGLPEAPPSSDGACGGGAPGRSGLCSPDNGGLCGTAHCARCDWLSRPKRWPSIGFPVRRSAQLAQQAERAAHPAQRFDGLEDRKCSDPATQPAWQAFPANYPTGSTNPVIPADPTYFFASLSAEPPRKQQPLAPHSPPIDEPAPFRARTDGFPPPPCAFTSTPADLPLETPRASRSMAEPWGGTAELAQALGGGGLAESGAVLGEDWRKPPPPGCGEAIQTHVASFWLTVLGQLEFLGEVSSALLGEAVPGGRNRQELGNEGSRKNAGSSNGGLSLSSAERVSHGCAQAAGAAEPMVGGSESRVEEWGEATGAMPVRLMAVPHMLSPDMRCRNISGFNVSGFNMGCPIDASVCGTTTVNLRGLASPPFNMGSLKPLSSASCLHLGEVLSATPPGQGTTAKNRTEPGRPYLRVRSTLSGQSSDLDMCRKGTGHSPASILDSPVPSDDSGCDSRPELVWGGQSTLSLGY
ncbi:unnamed protein product [Closterium sp. Naga37s-1]|nr:unnamed protein product [Closterium sp. Naga37s-1]